MALVKITMNTLRSALRKYGIQWILGLLLTCLAGAHVLNILPSTLVDRMDLLIYDMRTLLQPATPDSRIVIVNIDEKSLAEIGRWPWSRNVIADLVNKLTGYYTAKTITFDVVFAEPDTSSGYGILETLAHQELKDIPGFSKRIQALKPSLDFDSRLASAMQGYPVVLGYYLSNDPHAFRKGLLPPPAFTTAHLSGRRLDALFWKNYSANLAQLQQAAKAGGFMNPTPDSDGVIRKLPLLAQVGNNYYESLALATARLALGATTVQPIFLQSDEALMSEQDLRQYGALEAIQLNSPSHKTRIPVERYLTTLVQYHGTGGPSGGRFRYISAVDVLKQRLPSETLAHKIVLIGTTVAGLKDLRTAPMRLDYPGVEMHADVIASILDGDFKRQPDFSIGFDLLQILVIGLILSFTLPALKPVFSILFAAATMSTVSAANFWMYQSLNWVMPVATALLLVFSLFVMNIIWGYLFEHRKRHAMVSLFGEYVAPELVAEMAEHPESYNMEGENRELTVLFADVRGFTTISEGLDPNTLREYINLYLTAMSEDIRNNRGTLDKYIGDAIMAFWGAPVPFSDHASRAVATALLMQTTAQKLNHDFIARNWPPLKIGIGINTGPMRVGDMGSKIRRAYTVMGDVVNLSSRLEGITKIYGAGIVVGEATQRAAPEFAYRELDHVRVKGKNQPIPIFEPLGLDTALTEDKRNALHEWHQALQLIRTQHWEHAEAILTQLHQATPTDELYSLYLHRIEHYKLHPPGVDWDGVTTFESK